MLRQGNERFGMQWTKAVREFFGATATLRFEAIDSIVASEHIGRDNGMGLCAVLDAPAWSTPVLLSADASAIALFVEGLMGGQNAAPIPLVKRPATKIEARLAGFVLESMIKSLEAAFQPILPGHFLLRRMVDRPRLTDIGRRNDSLLVGRFRLEIGKGTGTLLFVIPYAAIAGQREIFSRTKFDEPKPADAAWCAHIQSELARTKVILRATLDEREVTLDEIAGLRVGGILPLQSGATSPVRVSCNGESLLWCRMGQTHGNYTLQVIGPIDHQREFVDEILAEA